MFLFCLGKEPQKTKPDKPLYSRLLRVLPTFTVKRIECVHVGCLYQYKISLEI